MNRREDRILGPLKRRPDGTFGSISLDLALDEIAGQVKRFIGESGPHSIAAFLGTTGYFNVPASQMLISWFGALRSRSFFSSYTIDCSSKAVTSGRLGMWNAGKQPFTSADVWLCFGNNPVVSLSIQAGVVLGNPAKTLKEAADRGMKLIVVDPRETETARQSELFLQPRPGEDPSIVAGIIRILFEQELIDADFCRSYTRGTDRLRAAVQPFTEEYVARRAGIDAHLLREAALMFGGAGKRGCAGAATGLTMSPHSNLVDHLVEVLNVLCGRYVRSGETMASVRPLRPRTPRYAEVISPIRPWDRGYKSRIGDFGLIPGICPRGELPSAILPDEILTPGDDQIRCLFVEGGNPAVAVPDQRRVAQALSSLDLLVTVDPFMSATARLAHYILPPKLMYERPDIPMLFGNQRTNFAQYSPPVVPAPDGSEVIDDWYLYWALAKRLGQTIDFCGRSLNGPHPPSTDELIAMVVDRGQVPFDELVKHPHGRMYDDLDPVVVESGRPEVAGHFDLLPDDVLQELASYLREVPDDKFTHRLTVRRMRQTMNSMDPATPTPRYNPAFMNPADMSALGLSAGDEVAIVSDYTEVAGIVHPDDRLRPGVVSMSHCHGGLPEEDQDPRGGSCTGKLVDSQRQRQAINAMPTMSGVPVKVEPRTRGRAGSFPLEAAPD
jgi:anaerobic selenocysteine-containing dehydrogenase